MAQPLFKERSRRTVSNVIEPIQTMDIVDRAVVSWVGTAAGTSVEMIGDALVDDSQRAERCPGIRRSTGHSSTFTAFRALQL